MINNILIFMLLTASCSNTRLAEMQSGCELDTLTNECVYTFVEKMPVYCEGERDFLTDILSHISIDEFNEQERITKVNIQLVINTKGNIIGIRLLDKQTLNTIEREILETIKKLDCTWTPGELNNKKVSVLLTYPINIDMF